MYEFGIDEFTSLSDFPGDKKSFGAKPMMIFLGSQWELDATYQKLQNLFLDLFRGFKPDKISLQGIDHVITCAVHDSKIYIRTYFVNYQKSNTQVPNISLQPMGPFLDLTVRRSKTAADDLWKLSIRRPKTYVSLSFTSFFFVFHTYWSKYLTGWCRRRLRILSAILLATRLVAFILKNKISISWVDVAWLPYAMATQRREAPLTLPMSPTVETRRRLGFKLKVVDKNEICKGRVCSYYYGKSSGV